MHQALIYIYPSPCPIPFKGRQHSTLSLMGPSSALLPNTPLSLTPPSPTYTPDPIPSMATSTALPSTASSSLPGPSSSSHLDKKAEDGLATGRIPSDDKYI